ncbi:Plant intracellular Ras-group-related LRR protein 8-like protein [Drosera capensis]
MAREATTEAASVFGEMIKVQIKFGGETTQLSLRPESTVGEVKSILQSLTNLLPRGQKLFHKGTVLANDGKTLRSSGIIDGSKIMLMASQGLHQGDGPKMNNAPVTSNYQRMMKKETTVERKNPNTRWVEPQASLEDKKSRSQRWKVTGVIALSHSNLQAIPEEVWDCASSVRVLDLSNNQISHVPPKIASLTHIQKVLLSENKVSDNSISWESFANLGSLTYLSLSDNELTTLPASLGGLTSLRQLHVSNNKLTGLPNELGYLSNLEILNLNNNRLSSIPASIGDCLSLVEVDLSSNLLVELPETFGCLLNLKALHVRNNGLKLLPSTIFKNCIKLSTLDIHGTQITMDEMRKAKGWEEFDERRRLKHQKQLDFRAGSSAEFDEGADKRC